MAEKRKIGIGSFDLYIGAALLGVVFVHTVELFPSENISVSIMVVAQLFSLVGVAGFALISGYKIVIPKNLKKYVFRTIAKYMKLHYIFGLATVVAFSVINFVCFHDAKWTIREAFFKAIGFLFAVFPEMKIGDVTISSCGPMHFVVAFMIAQVITIVLLSMGKSKLFNATFIIMLMISGSCIGTMFPGMPFALGEALLLTGCTYVGFEFKQIHYYEHAMGVRTALLYIVLAMIFLALSRVAYLRYLLYFCFIAIEMFNSIVLINYFLELTTISNKFVSVIKKIGKVSFFVLGAHTIEYFAIPWWYIRDILVNYPSELVLVLIYCCRFIIIFFLVKLSIIFVKKHRSTRKKSNILL